MLWNWFMEMTKRVVSALFVMRHGTEVLDAAHAIIVGHEKHKHAPRIRGVLHHKANVGGVETPSTDVLMVCDGCGDFMTSRLPGHWTRDQLTHEVPPGEVVETLLAEKKEETQ